MAELIAQGRNPNDQWRRELPENKPVVVGREQVEWAVPWDLFISRRHAEVVWHDGKLHVERLPRARNPIILDGKECNSFELGPGEFFIIGETTFLVGADPSTSSFSALPPVQEMTISPPDLAKVRVRDAEHHLDVLSRLPQMISGAANDAELFQRLVEMLLAGVRRSDAVALVAIENPEAEHPAVRILNSGVRRGDGDDFRPSRNLIIEAVLRRKTTLVHVWSGTPTSGGADYTLAGSFDWAFCSPLLSEACKDWGIYVTGRFSGSQAATFLAPVDKNELADDLKFIELVAAILRSLRQVKLLQRKQDSFCRFFSPAVLKTLTSTSDPERALQPRETQVSVLFCDLRGFSRQAELHAGDLIALLERVSKALGFMTQTILDNGGVIGDYQGDAAMGFWGWPLPQPDMVERACLAALGVRILFEASSRNPQHALSNFRVGIGMATGNAVAGQIGTTEQVKVTVFGPVVNLASRLEGMTKIFQTPILMDQATATVMREKIGPEVARSRRMALVQPYGMDQPLMVSELLPPLTEFPSLTNEHIASYEAALDAFIAGNWEQAYELLHQVPPTDRGKDFLLGYIIQNNHTPPPKWNGVIPLARK